MDTGSHGDKGDGKVNPRQRLNAWTQAVANSVKASIEEPAKSERTSADLVTQLQALNPLSQTFDDTYEGPEIDVFDTAVLGRWARGEW